MSIVARWLAETPHRVQPTTACISMTRRAGLSQICSLYPHFTRQGKGKTRGKWGRAQWRALSALRHLSSSSAYVRKGRCHRPSGGRWRFNQSAHEDSSAGYVVVCCSCRQFLVPSSLSVRYLLFMFLLSVAQPAQSGQWLYLYITVNFRFVRLLCLLAKSIVVPLYLRCN